MSEISGIIANASDVVALLKTYTTPLDDVVFTSDEVSMITSWWSSATTELRITQAVTMYENLSQSLQNDLNEAMFVFESFSDSASKMLSKLQTVSRNMAHDVDSPTS